MGDVKKTGGYCKSKQEASDRNVWRIGFETGYRPVVRQTAEWMNESVNEWILCIVYYNNINTQYIIIKCLHVQVSRAARRRWRHHDPPKRRGPVPQRRVAIPIRVPNPSPLIKGGNSCRNMLLRILWTKDSIDIEVQLLVIYILRVRCSPSVGWNWKIKEINGS
jgi:hypothetical protein